MRPSFLCASYGLCLLALPLSSFAQSSNSVAPKKNIVYGSLADPADTSRKRSSGATRLQASKSAADKTVRDSAGRITKIFEPDASGKLTLETDFEYNDAGKITAIKQLGAAGDPVRSRTFVYDANGKLLSQTSPEQGKTLYTLDDQEFIHSSTDARNLSKDYVYDAQHRLLSKTYSDGSPTAHFRYRSKKQSMFLAYLGDRSGADLQKIERYNKAGALDGTLQKYTDGSYATGRLAYDSFGRIRKIVYPDGRKLTQTWNRKGQLTSIKEGAVGYFGETRYATGDDLLTASLSGGLTLKKAYDESGRLFKLSILNGQQVLSGHRYHYNDFGSVDRVDDLVDTRTVNFDYDQLNRVAGFKDSIGDTRAFAYDAAGNLEDTSIADGNSTVDKHNRLHSSAGLSYDVAGEMTFDGAHTYTYNAEDLIASVDGGRVRYVYNAMGDLIERVSHKGTERFIWLTGQLLAKQEFDGTWTDYLYINGQRIASVHKPLPTEKNPEAKDEVTYFVADRVGVARAAVTADGTVTAAAIFSPFGKPLNDTPLAAAAESISYSGEVHDPYSGLNIYQFRSYNPQLGRWMSPDPSGLRFADLTNPQTFNLYTFVVNDPMKYFDAHGLYPCGDDPELVGPRSFEDAGEDDGGCDGGWGGGGGGGGDPPTDPPAPGVPPVVPVPPFGCGDNCGQYPTPPPVEPVPPFGCGDDCGPDPGVPTPGGPGNGNPDPGNGDPDPGNGNPDPGNGNPDPGNGEPDPGNGDPDPGNGNPDPGNGGNGPVYGDPYPGGGDPGPGPSDPCLFTQSSRSAAYVNGGCGNPEPPSVPTLREPINVKDRLALAQQLLSPKCKAKFASVIPGYSTSKFFAALNAADYHQYPNSYAPPQDPYGAYAATWPTTNDIDLLPDFYAVFGNDPNRQAYILIHEGIHLFGRGSLPDGTVQAALGIAVQTDTDNITDYIAGGCK